MAISLIDLPFKLDQSHNFVPDEQSGVTINAASNIILFKKIIKEAPLDIKQDIMVIHRYNKIGASNDQESMPEEFLTNTPYTCEAIVTNVSPEAKKFSLLCQIPLGSMPLALTKNMKSHFIDLGPYTTKKQTFDFYFPTPGVFQHFPSNVSVSGKVLSRGGANTLAVVATPSSKRIENFKDLLAEDLTDGVLRFMQSENLLQGKKSFKFKHMLYLLKDKAFFHKVIDILRERSIFIPEVWMYACFHCDDDTLIKEFFEMAK